ncbi:transglycosylase domain-containing protein, partial [Candidatus Woesebacteria bacterium]|nr:transglycosylase domain-containing protein [Candidatus Woesebacteria bacterium]
PRPGEVVRKDGFSTRIFDRNGHLLYDVHGDERRTYVPANQIPDTVKQATIAIEDKDFYKHSGFDVMTVIRIPYNLVARQRVVGGSTLTQQLVKKALLTDERSIERKFKELVLSLQIERTFTKDQILEMYLNEIPYGGNTAGVGAAAEMYFDKSVGELNLIESAILAGLPQRPSTYYPYSNKTDPDGNIYWQERTKGVLRRMREDEYITEIAYQDALAQLPDVQFSDPSTQLDAPHFVFYVRDQLSEMYGESAVLSGGLQVTTTLDLDLQKKAQAIVTEEVGKVTNLNISNGAAVVVEPDTGEILSMVGSRDYNNKDIGGEFNVVADGFRQPGSSIKPITYLTLLRKGYTPASILVDVPTTFASSASDNPYTPKNYDGTFRGPVSLRTSLGSSLNIPAVKALAIVGLDDFLGQAYDMGLETLEPTAENKRTFGLAVTLGGAEVHMLDMAQAYSSFATGGERNDVVSILSVKDKDGNTLFEHKQLPGKRVMSTGEAFLINHILSDNSARIPAFGANSLLNVGSGVAVKTGTTNNQKDNWAIGWSSSALVAAWVGNNDGSAMTSVASGVSGASPIWRRIMGVLIEKGYAAPTWQPPSDVEQVTVDAISGYPAHDEFASKTEYVLKNSLPPLPDPIHTKLKVCKGQEDKLANDARIAAGDFDEKEFVVLEERDPLSVDGTNRWQFGIDAWIAAGDNALYKVPTELCGEQGDVYVELKQPEDKKNYENEQIDIEVAADAHNGIEKIEIFVNDSLRETIQNREYKGSLNLPEGKYRIYAKAYVRDGGGEKISDTVRIGTGGVEWDEEDKPSPTPSPSPSPTPSPSPSADPEDDG